MRFPWSIFHPLVPATSSLRCRRVVVWLVAVMAVGLLTGCERLAEWGTPKPSDLADEAVSAGDFPKAVRFYETALDGTSKTADIHYRLAIIYDNHLKDPTSALHHYRRFLRMNADGSRKEEVDQSIERLQREMAARLGEGGLVSRAEAVRLRNENNSLRQQIAALRAQPTPGPTVRPAQAVSAPSPAASPPPVDREGFSRVPQTRKAEQVVGPETRTYTVQKGDTLAAISRKFYNTSARWKDIVDANHNQLGGSTSIREGQVLIIP